MILPGDTNCDFTKRPNDQLADNYAEAEHMSSIYALFNFQQVIDEPTRVTLETATIIDDLATTAARIIIRTGAHEVSLSDHFIVYRIRKFNGAINKDHKKIQTRSVKIYEKL